MGKFVSCAENAHIGRGNKPTLSVPTEVFDPSKERS